MAVEDLQYRLGRDQLAVYFSGDGSVSVEMLGEFLRISGKAARSKGIELQVVAVEHGSLSIVLDAVKSAGGMAKREITKSPLNLALSAASVLIAAMASSTDNPKPLERAGAEIVASGKAENIYIVTVKDVVEVMDIDRAAAVSERTKKRRLLKKSDVILIEEEGLVGALAGSVFDVNGTLHFRPEGRRFLLPIDESSPGLMQLFPGGRFRVRADLQLVAGQPDGLIIYRARAF